jgi:hypothetical protein
MRPEGISATEADEGDGESCSNHKPAVEKSSTSANAGISGTAEFWITTTFFAFQAKIGGRGRIGHPIYFGPERSIGGSNRALPCTYW